MIKIIAPTRIEVDGVDAGTVFKYYRDNKDNATICALIEQAFVDWHASHVIAKTAYERTAMEAVSEAVAAKDDIRRECDAKVAAIQADMDALGTKEAAQAKRNAQEIAKIDATIAELAAKKATLTQDVDGIFKAVL